MSRQKRRTAIGESFVVHSRSMLESPARRALSYTAMRVLDRIEIEHMNHGGAENGRLQVTMDQFVAYGIDRKGIAPAIRELVGLGFLEVTEPGHAGAAGKGRANHFRLTYVNCKSREEPTHEWRRIETIEIAEAIVKTAKRENSPRARDLGRRSWAARKENLSSRSGTESVPEVELKAENFSSRSGTTGSVPEVELLSRISGGQRSVEPQGLMPAPAFDLIEGAFLIGAHRIEVRRPVAPVRSLNAGQMAELLAASHPSNADTWPVLATVLGSPTPVLAE
jgi:hypothetical protein